MKRPTRMVEMLMCMPMLSRTMWMSMFALYIKCVIIPCCALDSSRRKAVDKWDSCSHLVIKCFSRRSDKPRVLLSSSSVAAVRFGPVWAPTSCQGAPDRGSRIEEYIVSSPCIKKINPPKYGNLKPKALIEGWKMMLYLFRCRCTWCSEFVSCFSLSLNFSEFSLENKVIKPFFGLHNSWENVSLYHCSHCQVFVLFVFCLLCVMCLGHVQMCSTLSLWLLLKFVVCCFVCWAALVSHSIVAAIVESFFIVFVCYLLYVWAMCKCVLLSLWPLPKFLLFVVLCVGLYVMIDLKFLFLVAPPEVPLWSPTQQLHPLSWASQHPRIASPH